MLKSLQPARVLHERTCRGIWQQFSGRFAAGVDGIRDLGAVQQRGGHEHEKVQIMSGEEFVCDEEVVCDCREILTQKRETGMIERRKLSR